MSDVEARLRDLGERVAEEPFRYELPRRRIVRRARARRATFLLAPAAAVVMATAIVVPRVDWPGAGRPAHVAVLADAIGATEAAATARTEIEMEFTFGDEVYTTRASGEIDFETGLTHLVAELSEPEGERVIEVITAGARTFERPLDPPGAKWHVRPVAPPGAPAGPATTDPQGFFGWIESTAQEVTRVGTEVRDAVSTTRYRVVLDPVKMQEQTGIEAAEGLEVTHHPMDVWVDERGLVREVTFGITARLDGVEMSTAGSSRLFDFGVPVDVEVPSGDEVTGRPLSGTETHPGPGPRPEVDDADFVVGAGWLREPHVIVHGADRPSPLVCVVTLDDDPVQAALKTDDGMTVLTIDRRDFAEWESRFGAGVGCVETTHDHVSLAEAERYTLLVRWEGGRAVVPLETAMRPADGE